MKNKKRMKTFKQQLLAIAALIALIWAFTGFRAAMQRQAAIEGEAMMEGDVFSTGTSGTVVADAASNTAETGE